MIISVSNVCDHFDSQITSLDDSTGDDNVVTPPTDEDAESFKAAAEEALGSIAITDLSKTDLADTCGVSLYPCAQKVITCAESKLVKTDKGGITPLTGACDCFSHGITGSIAVPDKPDAVFTCSFTCVDSLLKFTAQYVADANGANGASLTCDINSFAANEFGNKNHYIATPTDNDPMEAVSIDDPTVLRAAEALRININSARLAKCPEKKPYEEEGKIEYAKKGLTAQGKSQYRMEVVFGTDAVLGRIAHLPRSEQVVDPGTQAALNDTENLNGRFVLMSITPGPCDDAVEEQLAVSASGALSCISLNPLKCAREKRLFCRKTEVVVLFCNCRVE